MEHILHLQSQGELLFGKKLFSPTLIDYFRSTKALWYWIVISLTLVTAISVFFVSENSFPFIYGRHILGSLFVLLLPGYSLIKALFPTRELDNVERTALSIGLSLALVSIIGLALNYTPWGIRVTPITLGLLMLNTIFATTAIIRAYNQLIKRLLPLHRT